MLGAPPGLTSCAAFEAGSDRFRHNSGDIGRDMRAAVRHKREDRVMKQAALFGTASIVFVCMSSAAGLAANTSKSDCIEECRTDRGRCVAYCGTDHGCVNTCEKLCVDDCDKLFPK